MNEFELVKAGVHVDQHDPANAATRLLVFLIEAKWLANPDCVATMHVKASYNQQSKKLDNVAFRGEAEVPVATPLPAWFKDFSKLVATTDWATASPVEMVKGLDAYFKDFAEKGK